MPCLVGKTPYFFIEDLTKIKQILYPQNKFYDSVIFYSKWITKFFPLLIDQLYFFSNVLFPVSDKKFFNLIFSSDEAKSLKSEGI